MEIDNFRLDQSLKNTAECWNNFIYNEKYLEKDDINDFRKCIHDAQRIILTIKYKNENE